MIRIEINGHKFTAKHFVFSGGEVQTSIAGLDNRNWENMINIEAHLQSSDDIISLLQVNDILVRKFPESRRNLSMAYAPYARQDRACAEGESLACKVFATMINSCNFGEVTVVDCHSDVLPALLNNCRNISALQVIQISELSTILMKTDCVLVSPDAGANKKVNEVGVAYQVPIIRADKSRDVKTGAITGTEVFCDNLQGKHCIIVDDICDGGFTFVKLAEALKAKGAGMITLYVTHGIFSKGLEVFDGLIDHVYTTTSFRSDVVSNKLRTIRI